MTIEPEPRRESVVAEPQGLWSRSPVRLHEEILPPKLDPPTPAAMRSSRRALAILALVVIFIQPISLPIGHWLNSVARSGTDAYSIWQRYASAPVPDILVIGASPAQADVDEAGLSAVLSKAAGRSVTVEKLGFIGQGPLFYDALMYRIMKRPQHPKLVVLMTGVPDLNAGCTCLTHFTASLWDISDLTDPGFVRLALRVDPDPARLAAGWVLPSLAYYPSVVALQCLAIDYGRTAAVSILGRVPQQLQNPSICENQPGYLFTVWWAHQPAMTQANIQVSIQNYRSFMSDYQISPNLVSSLEDTISRARAGGVNVVLVEAPLHSEARSLFPADQQVYQQQMQALASSLNVHLVDLSESVPDDPTLWVDTLHLDRAGAAYFAPTLAGALPPILVG
jgi:hypothetical protein